MKSKSSASRPEPAGRGADDDGRLLAWRDGPDQLTDASDKGREAVTAGRALVPTGVVRAGKVPIAPPAEQQLT
jgi:hypothetical protein